MLVKVVVFGFKRCFAAVPGAGIDKELALENEKVRIASVPLVHAEAVNLFPLLCVSAGENYNRRRGMHHVAVGTATKRQIEVVLEPNQVGESIMLPVMKHAADVGDFYFRQPAGRRLRLQGNHKENQENSHKIDLPARFRKHKTRKSFHRYSFLFF